MAVPETPPAALCVCFAKITVAILSDNINAVLQWFRLSAYRRMIGEFIMVLNNYVQNVSWIFLAIYDMDKL